MRSLTRLAPVLIPAYLAASVLAGVNEVWWNITYVQGVNPDGRYPRRVIGVNNSWPPPPIHVDSSDSLQLHVLNTLDQPTTLHHHGMFFQNSSWMDGARGISQCGIPPGAQFTYVVPIDTEDQWGTYWVHAHSAGQYVDGLRAPLIIHPSKEIYQYDEEFTVVLGDWYHTEHSVLIAKFISPSNPTGVHPMPDSGLIYFSNNDGYLPSTQGNSGVGFNENATLPFQPGKTYRLRIINTSAFLSFVFWLDGHDMRIIEADGTDIEESPIDTLTVAVAQRYSVLVTARNDRSSNWAIHANMDPPFAPLTPNLNTTSSITYNISAPLKNSGNVSAYHDVNDISFVPIPAIVQPRVTKTICLEVNLTLMTDGTFRAMFNGITHNFPLVPAMFSAMTLGENATVAEAYGPSSFVLNYGDVVDLVVKNVDLVGGHPFHLHGHEFMIVGRSQLNYTSTNDLALNPPIVEGQANPMRRDTVWIPAGTSATLRFVADNPGVWLFHCHIEWHFEAGLAIQLIEAPLMAQKMSSNFPQILARQCEELHLPYSGNAAGHQSVTDLTGLPLGPYPVQPIGNNSACPADAA